MLGWKGKVLFINLKTKTTSEASLDPKVARDYIGGRGLGIYYLTQLLDPQFDPLSSENILIIATGPLTDTGAPTGARYYMVMTKSPLTGQLPVPIQGVSFRPNLNEAVMMLLSLKENLINRSIYG